MIIPGIVALIYRDGAGVHLATFIVALIIGLMLWIPNRHKKVSLSLKKAFLLLSYFGRYWVVRALPFIFF